VTDADKAGEDPQAAAGAAQHQTSTLLRWMIQAASLAALRGEIAAIARRTSRRVVLMAVALLLWALVAGFLLAAFVVWLAGVVGAIWACVILAAVFAVVALVLHLVSARMARDQPWTRFKAHVRELVEAAGQGVVEEGAVGALAVIALVGYILGRSRRR
jgi:hypothetical protein